MNVFFIETPLQLVNAIEAKHALELTDNHVVILLSDIYPVGLFRPLLGDEQWDSAQYVDSRVPARHALHRLRDHPSQRIRSYYETTELRDLRKRLDALAGSLGVADALVLGNYCLDHMRHFANALSHEKLILIDDGTTTLDIADDRRRYAAGRSPRVRRSRTDALVNFLIGWRLGHRDRATFFTVYDMDVGSADTLVRHSYDYLRGRASEFECNGEVLFLGQTIYYEGISEDAYLDELRRVGAHFAGDTLVYAPHKGEKPDRVERIRQELGWEIRRYDAPIEYQLAMRGPLPRILASFYSSALENCRLIFGSRLMIESVYLDPGLVPRAAAFVRSVYDYYESKTSEHFRVVRL
jgi:hypothetical protein